MGTRRYEDLEVWKFAHRAVLETYRIPRGYPSDERYGLVTQMSRSAVSVAANIAEGFGRRQPRDKIKFYNYSQGSVEELSYYFRVSKDLGYVADCGEVGGLLDSTGRMLKRLVQKTAGGLPHLPQVPDSSF